MKRFFLSFLFYTLCSFSFGQNLIPNPSAEDIIECPEQLGGWPEDGNGIDRYAPPWQTYRGTPDYFNECSDILGADNPFGYQEPRTGQGYIGAIPFHQNLSNAREYFGIELTEPLIVGETYTLSFFVSLALKFNVADRAVNRLGFLLMTSNYIEYTEGQGEVLYNPTYSTNYIVNDTTNWVQISSTIDVDSAYQFVAFGNFFDDDNTLVELQIPDGIAWTSYYYFDDFCLSFGNECDIINNVVKTENIDFKLFPNPAEHELNITSSYGVQTFQVYNILGELLMNVVTSNQLELRVDLDLMPGVYITKIKTEKGYFTKRFMVQF